MLPMTSGLAARRARLGKTVTTLRRQRRIAVEAAASRAGMSSTTWQRVEDGNGVRALTYRGVENVLGLRAFIIDELLNGTADWSELDSEPTGQPDSAVALNVEHLSDEEREALRRVRDAMRRNSA